MGGKRKARKKAPPEGNAIAEEELSALESIYGDGLEVDSDRHGFCVEVIPHPVGTSLSDLSQCAPVLHLPFLLLTQHDRHRLISSVLHRSQVQVHTCCMLV